MSSVRFAPAGTLGNSRRETCGATGRTEGRPRVAARSQMVAKVTDGGQGHRWWPRSQMMTLVIKQSKSLSGGFYHVGFECGVAVLYLNNIQYTLILINLSNNKNFISNSTNLLSLILT